MRRPSVASATTASGPDYLVCPGCGCGQLQPPPPHPPRRLLSRLLECDFCECAFDNTTVETLGQIVTLPEALGKHSCECGHPEMRRLPDGVFHCPACRAEVLPISIPGPGRIAARRSLAAFERGLDEATKRAKKEMKKEVRSDAREMERAIDAL